MLLRIHAAYFGGIVRGHHGYGTQAELGDEKREGIGQVKFPLCIFSVNALQDIEEHVGIENVNSGIDLGNPFLLRRGVLLLNNFFEAAARSANDAPIAGRVGHDDGKYRGAGTAGAVLGEEFQGGRSGEQGNIAGKDEDVAREIAELPLGLLNGVSGAKLLFLNSGSNARELFTDICGHGLPAIADNANNGSSLDVLAQAQNMPEHRFAADGVENFCERGVLHPLALSGGKDDGGKGTGSFSR